MREKLLGEQNLKKKKKTRVSRSFSVLFYNVPVVSDSTTINWRWFLRSFMLYIFMLWKYIYVTLIDYQSDFTVFSHQSMWFSSDPWQKNIVVTQMKLKIIRVDTAFYTELLRLLNISENLCEMSDNLCSTSENIQISSHIIVYQIVEWGTFFHRE